MQVGLAWATVQLHCFCTVNHTKVAIPGAGPDTRGGAEGLITRKNSATSYQPTAGEAGVCVLSTPAKILACDLTLHPDPGQPSVLFKLFEIPMDLLLSSLPSSGDTLGIQFRIF